ncbi:MAG: hypothetical protein MjAS7_0114 [Metallosphaera javensis (ex Sakai et al. 2022)]|nr:MAG: hypothetical protein MjAS7_0114 [Metallosphaera javensis (ex Sakai et al. 2022)]
MLNFSQSGHSLDRSIFHALREVKYLDELQLTDGIRRLVQGGVKFKAVLSREVFDLGNFEGYVSYLKGGR